MRDLFQSRIEDITSKIRDLQEKHKEAVYPLRSTFSIEIRNLMNERRRLREIRDKIKTEE